MNLGTSDHDKMTSSGNLDVLDVIGIIFITLKIIGVEPVAIWPWWAVLMPLWIYIGATAFMALAVWCIKTRKN
jgi:hypothetical protein